MRRKRGEERQTGNQEVFTVILEMQTKTFANLGSNKVVGMVGGEEIIKKNIRCPLRYGGRVGGGVGVNPAPFFSLQKNQCGERFCENVNGLPKR